MCKVKHYPLVGFSKRLNDTFLKSGLTQIRLAEIIGIERKSIANYLYGVSEPQASILAKICKELHVSADYLLFGEKRNDEV